MIPLQKWLASLQSWYRRGYGFDTPQGLLVLLAVPRCLLAAIAAFLWPPETRPLFLSGEPLVFLFTPLLAFVFFVRQGQLRGYAASMYSSLLILAIVSMPFYIPYFRH